MNYVERLVFDIILERNHLKTDVILQYLESHLNEVIHGILNAVYSMYSNAAYLNSANAVIQSHLIRLTSFDIIRLEEI